MRRRTRMPLDPNPIAATNLILALAILILGVWAYESKKESLALYVALGFGLFAISHALTLLGYGDVQAVIIPIRVLGYLAVISGLVLLLLLRTGKVSRAQPYGEPKVAERKQAAQSP